MKSSSRQSSSDRRGAWPAIMVTRDLLDGLAWFRLGRENPSVNAEKPSENPQECRVGHRYRVREIAQQAGLSEATVDRVLHGRPGVRASTAAEVEQAISDLDR